MFNASEFRKFAGESLDAARAAESDEKRKHYLDMAKMWTLAAAELDGGTIPTNVEMMTAAKD
jgi:hypothetical protein